MSVQQLVACVALAAVFIVGACTGDSATPQPAASGAADSETQNNQTDEVAAMYELKIEGMMCDHCQAAVTELLKGLEGVAEVKVDHKADNAIITMNPGAKLDETRARDLIDRDYKLTSCSEIPAAS